MKKLSYKNRCKLACHAHVSTLFTGHEQRFIHTHVTRSPPIGIAKLSVVFMNQQLQTGMIFGHWTKSRSTRADLHVHMVWDEIDLRLFKNNFDDLSEGQKNVKADLSRKRNKP